MQSGATRLEKVGGLFDARVEVPRYLNRSALRKCQCIFYNVSVSWAPRLLDVAWFLPWSSSMGAAL